MVCLFACTCAYIHVCEFIRVEWRNGFVGRLIVGDTSRGNSAGEMIVLCGRGAWERKG